MIPMKMFAAAVLLLAASAQGIVTDSPLTPDARMIVAEWNGSTCVPIGPYHALTAKHTWGPVGQVVITPDGVQHTSVEVVPNDDPWADVTVIRVDTPFTKWHPLLRRPVVTGERFVMAGNGRIGVSGEEVHYPRSPVFAENIVAGVYSDLSGAFSCDYSGPPDALPHEGYFVINDSGGGGLFDEGGVLKMGGTVVSANSPYMGIPGQGYVNGLQAMSDKLVWLDATIGTNVDVNEDGVLNEQDIFAYLDRWFAGDITADANRNGRLDIGDVFKFLQLWFALN